MTTTLQAHLLRLGACAEAVEWAAPYETLDAAWAACERPDWLLWRLVVPTGSRVGHAVHASVAAAAASFAAASSAAELCALIRQRHPCPPTR